MSYSLVWSPKSRKSMEGLDKRLVLRIVRKMRKVAESPYSFLEKIRSEKGFKVRVGNHRVLVDLNKEKREIHVLAVRHRRDAYKKG